MKRIYFFCSLLLSLLLTSCGDYDDSAIQNKLNDFKERITALQTKANKLNEDISKLSYLTEGNVITSVTRNSDGQYVITYKDSKTRSHTDGFRRNNANYWNKREICRFYLYSSIIWFCPVLEELGK